ncbi:MAG: transglycosylase SLT domain-containing protein [Acidobacteriia bacterium]|nr:transglycosylase SLT domain-containing protein [Terriglobia bacterium]
MSPNTSLPADLLALARAAAARHSLDPALVCAVVEQESSWDAHAIRYEPAFRARYVAPLALPPTEEIARSISWGLLQVMGQVAREHGFRGKFLSALCDPATGLDIGCQGRPRATAGSVRSLWSAAARRRFAAPLPHFASTAAKQASPRRSGNTVRRIKAGASPALPSRTRCPLHHAVLPSPPCGRGIPLRPAPATRPREEGFLVAPANAPGRSPRASLLAMTTGEHSASLL